MIISICIVILALNFSVIPFAFLADGFIDVFVNEGTIEVSLFGFVKLFKTEVYLRHLDPLRNNLVVKGKNKEYEFHINADKRDEKSIIKFFDVDFLPYINIVTLELELEVGKRDDAFFTTMTLGAIRIIFYSIFAALKSSQKLDVRENFVAEYNRDLFRTSFFGIINISIADIIFSFILYLGKKIAKKSRIGGKRVDTGA